MTATALDSSGNLNIINWSGGRDKEGHRNFKLKVRVHTTSVFDNLIAVFNATGLPVVGSVWSFGNDTDFWAFCSPEMGLERHGDIKEGHPGRWWNVSLNFTTIPFKRCQDFQIEDPLAEPYKISGSFARYMKPVQKDRFGKTPMSSSHEPITGLEKDDNRPSVIIEYNSLSLGLDVFSPMVNTLNDAPLWGLGARKIMLTNVSWSRQLYGACTFYYTHRFEFEVRWDGFDLDDVLDKGFKVIAGDWSDGFPKVWIPDDDADASLPGDFVLFQDYKGGTAPTPVALNGFGAPLADPSAPSFRPTIELSDESNFLLLGIPSTLA